MKISIFSTFLTMSLTENLLLTKTMGEWVETPTSCTKKKGQQPAPKIKQWCSNKTKKIKHFLKKMRKTKSTEIPRVRIKGSENNIKLNGINNWKPARLAPSRTKWNPSLRNIDKLPHSCLILKRWRGTPNKLTKYGKSKKLLENRNLM